MSASNGAQPGRGSVGDDATVRHDHQNGSGSPERESQEGSYADSARDGGRGEGFDGTVRRDIHSDSGAMDVDREEVPVESGTASAIRTRGTAPDAASSLVAAYTQATSRNGLTNEVVSATRYPAQAGHSENDGSSSMRWVFYQPVASAARTRGIAPDAASSLIAAYNRALSRIGDTAGETSATRSPAQAEDGDADNDGDGVDGRVQDSQSNPPNGQP